jgi:hypothetical protein
MGQPACKEKLTKPNTDKKDLTGINKEETNGLVLRTIFKTSPKGKVPTYTNKQSICG